ncbi:hypothetical protein L1049_002634 [Liquidambar formosana]|uniref:Uncharacterized protein n=1 Tax=Liquidambar formosana TaxID=63359 RepID=A0AAP0R907_LIQFO
MRDCAKKSTGCLPYGNALTEVFKIFEVNIGNETDAYNAKASDIYDEAMLRRMKFVQNATGFQDVGNCITDLEHRQGNVEDILQQYAPYFPPPPED